MLHDIGKVQVPDEILHKPGKLEAEEWETMKLHVNFGEAYLGQIAVDQMIIKICAQHHERLDSTRYPQAGEDEKILKAVDPERLEVKIPIMDFI